MGCHFLLQCVKVKSESEVAQSCLTPSDPMDCSPPGSSVHGIFQARVLEWGATAFSDSLLYWSLKELARFMYHKGFPGDSVVKNLPVNAGQLGLIPGSGRPPGGGNGHPLQSSCLQNPMDRGAWWATVQGGHKELDTTVQLPHT